MLTNSLQYYLPALWGFLCYMIKLPLWEADKPTPQRMGAAKAVLENVINGCKLKGIGLYKALGGAAGEYKGLEVFIIRNH
jgi:hypothetical protein